jgi:hypothetical protein
MNIWEHQALAAAGKLEADAAPVLKKVGEALLHGAERTASEVEKDIAAHVAAHAQSTSGEGVMEKALHAVEHALHIGSQEAKAEPQAGASAPQAPVAAPQDVAGDRKAALLAELHDLETKVEHLGD